MKIKELINLCPFKQVRSKIILHYGDKEIDEYESLYNMLKTMEIDKSLSHETLIYIYAYEEHEDDDQRVLEFDEDNTSLYYDVSAYVENDENVYSIAGETYSNFLQCSIDEKTLNDFSKETILAHCFYEIAYYGFEDNQ